MTQGDTKVTIFTTQLFFLCQMILQLPRSSWRIENISTRLEEGGG